jgi:hypothetical protein
MVKCDSMLVMVVMHVMSEWLNECNVVELIGRVWYASSDGQVIVIALLQ